MMFLVLLKGDEVVINGGIVGCVEEVGESFFMVEIVFNVKVCVQKGVVLQVLFKGLLKLV